MNCEEFEKQWQDLENPSHLSAVLEEHHKACSPCAAWVGDLDRIRRLARELPVAEEPPSRVWLNLRSHLEQEGLIRGTAGRPWFARWPVFGWFPNLAMNFAYLTVFLLAFGVVFSLRNSLMNTNAPASPPVPVAAVTSKPVEPFPSPAVRDEAVRRVIEKAPPERRTAYLARWQQLNSSMDELQRFVEVNPDDALVRAQLYTIREQQERLLETMVRWEEF